eukprot:6685030-Alexandrium_andersonii.AAC.1
MRHRIPGGPQCPGPAQKVGLVHRGLRGPEPACPFGQLARHRGFCARRQRGGGPRDGQLRTPSGALAQAMARA